MNRKARRSGLNTLFRWSSSFEVVLPFAQGGFAKVDGILGAAMVAAHTVSAMTVPLGAVILHCDVLQRAVLGADSAAYACVRYRELAVGYEQTVKEGLQYI